MYEYQDFQNVNLRGHLKWIIINEVFLNEIVGSNVFITSDSAANYESTVALLELPSKNLKFLSLGFNYHTIYSIN